MIRMGGRAYPIGGRLSVLVVLLAIGALVGSASETRSAPRVQVAVSRVAQAGISEAIRIDVRLQTARKGTFVLTGAEADRGAVASFQRVASGNVQLTQTLVGASGVITIRGMRSCARASGTWRVTSGTKAYEGLTGGGKASGGPSCANTRYPLRITYTGSVRSPVPPALAEPGRYGGGTSQKNEVVLDVDPGGRTLSGLQLRLTAPCTGGVVNSTVAVLRLPGPYPIAADGSFDIPVSQGFQTGRVRGRFTSKTIVEGTAEVSTSVTVTTTNTTYSCVGSVTWRASQPPPTAPPGRYCGFSLQGPGVCFDVAANGREVTRFEGGVVALCFPGGVAPSEFEFTLTLTGAVPIGGHLGFASGQIPLEGVSATASFSGLIDTSGTATGTVSLSAFTLVDEGTSYRCQRAVGRWEAKRQT